jgi:hypothetical protein
MIRYVLLAAILTLFLAFLAFIIPLKWFLILLAAIILLAPFATSGKGDRNYYE